MAIDEAILLANAEGRAPPTLRFFSWAPPCLSLGYAQAAAEADLDRLRRFGFDLVRRPTGGRAILHTDELTYSVIAPMDEPRVHGGVIESYQQLSAGLMRGLAHLGLAARANKEYPAWHPVGQDAMQGAAPSGAAKGPVCFEVPSNYEITAGASDQPRKLLGSAQVRKQGIVLQHGTLPLAGDLARICDVLVFASDAERARVRARIHQRAATAAEVLGRNVTWDEAAAALGRGFAEALNLDLVPGGLTETEQALTARLRAEKYATSPWNFRR
jgi:lipoate-protein ligase A